MIIKLANEKYRKKFINLKIKTMKKITKSDNNASEQNFDRISTKYDIKQKLEEKENAKLINFNDLCKISPSFSVWLKDIIRYGNVDSIVLIYHYPSKINKFKCLFYTENYSYSITGSEGKRGESGYLGCISSCRKSRPGEFWTRGHDLPDGKFSHDTWIQILKAIIRNELKVLQIQK